MKNNYFIIHGSFGSPFVNWVPYLRKEIESKNLEELIEIFNLKDDKNIDSTKIKK